MKKPIFHTVLALLLACSAQLFGQVNYTVTANGHSRFFWPFVDGTSWSNKAYSQGGGNFHYCQKFGSICHDYSDYYAQDWWLSPYSYCGGDQENVLGKNFRSPVYGRVMFVDNYYNGSSDSFGCQLILELMDQHGFLTGFALRIIHLQSGSIVVSEGQVVTPYQLLAQVGNTGPNAGFAHIHMALYKDIDQNIPAYNETGRYRLERGWTVSEGPMCDDDSPGQKTDNRFATPFLMDATTTDGNFCFQPTVNLNATVDYLYFCEAIQYATVNGRITNSGRVNLISPSTSISNLSVDQGGILHIKLAGPQKTKTPVAPEPEEAEEKKGLVAYPNPFVEEVTMAFELKQETDFDLAIYDLTGRKVKVMGEGKLQAGIHSRRWDGRTESGSLAPAGQYLIRLSTPTEQHVTRVSLQR